MDSTTTTFNLTLHEDYDWGSPELVKTIVNDDNIELVYEQRQTTWMDWSGQQTRCFKVRYSSQGGKWHQSERIWGTIVPATKKDYDFSDDGLTDNGPAVVLCGSSKADFFITDFGSDVDNVQPLKQPENEIDA